MFTRVLLATGVCCRTWPIAVDYTIGRCGLCGQVPTIDSDQLIEQIYIDLTPIDERGRSNDG